MWGLMPRGLGGGAGFHAAGRPGRRSPVLWRGTGTGSDATGGSAQGFHATGRPSGGSHAARGTGVGVS